MADNNFGKQEAEARIKQFLRAQLGELLDHAEFIEFSHDQSLTDLESAGRRLLETRVVAVARNGERLVLHFVRSNGGKRELGPVGAPPTDVERKWVRDMADLEKQAEGDPPKL